MTTDKIKDQLIDFNRQFKKNSGHFKSFEVIFDYISFLKSEPYLKELLDPLFAYVNKQLEVMKDTAKSPEKSQEFNNISVDILDPSTLSGMPIFSQEFETWQKALESKQDVSLMALLPVNLLCLLIVSIEMQEIKDKIKEIQAEKEQRFLNSFNAINKNFVETLNKLSLGDLALHIEKNDMDEISGVSIKSNKRGTISLSGGEKSLVTISFLFSVLLLEPSVFYLLDEIDADLDYNNSEKIYTMLDEFSKNTQMLMITHNPVIVNKSENVIGVSKNAHGVTTVFVKQIENVTQL